MGLVQAGTSGVLDAWIGYYRPYATSHEDLDPGSRHFARVTNAALSLAAMIAQIRTGQYRPPDENLHEPRQK